jgi:hypothetical protein
MLSAITAEMRRLFPQAVIWQPLAYSFTAIYASVAKLLSKVRKEVVVCIMPPCQLLLTPFVLCFSGACRLSGPWRLGPLDWSRSRWTRLWEHRRSSRRSTVPRSTQSEGNCGTLRDTSGAPGVPR